MPCTTVTVGPEPQPGAEVRNLQAGGGEQSVSVDWDIANTGNVATQADWELTVAGNSITGSTTLQVGESLHFGRDVQLNNQQQMQEQVCVNITNTAEA